MDSLDSAPAGRRGPAALGSREMGGFLLGSPKWKLKKNTRLPRKTLTGVASGVLALSHFALTLGGLGYGKSKRLRCALQREAARGRMLIRWSGNEICSTSSVIGNIPSDIVIGKA